MSATVSTADRADFWAVLGHTDARECVSAPNTTPGRAHVAVLNGVVLSLQMAADESDEAIVAYVRAFLADAPELPDPVAIATARLHQLDPQIANPGLLMERVFGEEETS